MTLDNPNKKGTFLKKALRDYTPHTQTVSAVDDEPVQTTTRKMFFAANEN